MSVNHPANRGRRRGAPLVILAMLLSFWVGVRVLLWAAPRPDAAVQIGMAVPALSARAGAAQRADDRRGEVAGPLATDAEALSPPVKTAEEPAAPDAGPVAPVPPAGVPAPPLIWNGPTAPPLLAVPQAAAGHQWLWLAAMSHQPETVLAEPASSEVGLAGDNR